MNGDPEVVKQRLDLAAWTSLIPVALGAFFIGGQLLTVWFLSRFSISPSHLGLSQLDSIVAAATLSIPAVVVALFGAVGGALVGAWIGETVPKGSVNNALAWVAVIPAALLFPSTFGWVSIELADDAGDRIASAWRMALAISWLSAVSTAIWASFTARLDGFGSLRTAGQLLWFLSAFGIFILAVGTAADAVRHEADLVEAAWVEGRPDPLPFGYLLPKPIAVLIPAGSSTSCVLILGESDGTSLILRHDPDADADAQVQRADPAGTAGTLVPGCEWSSET